MALKYISENDRYEMGWKWNKAVDEIECRYIYMTDIEGWQSRANINIIRSLKEKTKTDKKTGQIF